MHLRIVHTLFSCKAIISHLLVLSSSYISATSQPSSVPELFPRWTVGISADTIWTVSVLMSLPSLRTLVRLPLYHFCNHFGTLLHRHSSYNIFIRTSIQSLLTISAITPSIQGAFPLHILRTARSISWEMGIPCHLSKSHLTHSHCIALWGKNSSNKIFIVFIHRHPSIYTHRTYHIRLLLSSTDFVHHISLISIPFLANIFPPIIFILLHNNLVLIFLHAITILRIFV